MRRLPPFSSGTIGALAATLMMLAAPTPALAATTPVDIETVPPGAEVFLVTADGAESSVGTTPLKGHRLSRGLQALRFRLSGYKDLVETVEVGKRPSRFVFRLTTEAQPATLKISGPPDSLGAALTWNGIEQGTIPKTLSAQPGRHHIVATKPGFHRWERWIELGDGQTLDLSVVLTPERVAPGTLMVTSTPAGATVRLDGKERGAAPITLEDLEVGDHLLEVQLDGYEAFSTQVTIRSAQRSTVAARLTALAPTTGGLKVIVGVKGATVRLDGGEAAPAPLKKKALTPGIHLVEASAEGYETARREVTVRAGETSVIRLSLTASGKAAPATASGGEAPAPAKVRVVANVTGAQASVDGGAAAPVPTAFEIPTPGTHFIRVTAPDHVPWSKQVTTTPGQALEVVAELYQTGKLEVSVDSGGEAEVLVDGDVVGRTPLMHELKVGPHEITVRRGDDASETHTVTVRYGEPTTLTTFVPDSPAHGSRGFPLSAQSIRSGGGSLDMSLGWPYLAEVRLNAGIHEAIDIGFTFRNMLDTISEFEGRFKYLIARTAAFGFAAEAGIGGGGGSDDRNSFLLRTRLLGSVFIGDKVALTARLGLYIFSDRLACVPRSAGSGACVYTDDNENLLSGSVPSDHRDSGLELHTGLSVEFAVADDWNFFLLFDGLPVRTGSHKGRLLFNEGVGGDAKNQKFRAAAGASLLF